MRGAQYTAGDNDCHVKKQVYGCLADAQLGKTTSSGRARVGMNGVERGVDVLLARSPRSINLPLKAYFCQSIASLLLFSCSITSALLQPHRL